MHVELYELVRKGKRERSLASPANTDIAYHDHRHGQAVTGEDVIAIQHAAQCSQCTEQPADRQQHQMQRCDAIPVALQA
jgi:hypothetical protein